MFTPVLAGRPGPSPIIIPILAVAFGALIAYFGVMGASKRFRFLNLLAWGIALLAWGVWCFNASAEKRARYSGFIWRGTTSGKLLQIASMAVYRIEEREELPVTFAAFVLPGESDLPADVFLTSESSLDAEDVRIGPYTLEQIQGGEMTLEQLEKAVLTGAMRSEWERIGDFVFSHSVDAYRSEDGQLVVGLSTPSPYTGVRYIVYADRHLEWGQTGPDWIKAQNDYRASLALDPLPPLP